MSKEEKPVEPGLSRSNTKIITSISEPLYTSVVSSASSPVYTVPYLTAQAQNGAVNVSTAAFSLTSLIAPYTIVCQITNSNASKNTAIQSILVNSTVNTSYSIIRNGTLNGTVTSQAVYNVNDNYLAATTTAVKSAAATAGLSVSGGNTLLQQLSLPNAYNPVTITPIIIKPASVLYVVVTTPILSAIQTVTINVVFIEY